MLANRRRSPLEHLLDYPGWISRITRPLSEARDYVKISEIWCINNRSFVFNMALLFLRSIAKPFLLYPVSMSTQREDGTSEPTVISRRQAELVEANERLQRTAQNFSLEWKSFLRYAMKIKQQATAPGGKELEDLLLKTQGGLVLIRELRNRRDQQWKEVAECYGYQRLSITDNNTDGDDTQQSTKQQKWLQILVSKLFQLNLQVAATAHCAVKRSQSILSPNLLKLRAHALETYHRMEHGVEGSIDFVHAQDVNFLLQFDYLKHQQSIVLERFCIRLKWLPVSHRFHLRQRMLALIHQQKMKNTPRPSASTAYRNSEEHIHCPLLMTSTTHFIAELKALTQQYSLSLPDVDNREYEGFRQSADECLDAVVISFPPDNAINTDRELEMNLETLVHTYTRSSRWDLIQRGYLGNCEPGQGPIEDALIALRNEHKIDSLLACEWELLTLDGTEYLRVRLEKLSKAHSNRAQVDVAAVTGIKTVEYQHVETTEEAADSNNDDANGMSELTNSWNPDALYSLYALRVSSCRAKRLSLLRLLNYLHFIQFSQVNSRHDISSNSTDNTQQKPTTPISSKTGTVSVEDITINPWRVTKCETSGDYIITRPQSTAKNDINDDENDNNGDREFIFAAARRDLEVLELQVLRIASIFIFKQEYDSLPTSPHKRSNGRNASQRESDFVVTPIDRLQVLRDIYDCEVAFQQAKVQLVEILLENGLQFAPRSQDLSELNFTLEAQIDPFADILLPLLHQRPYLDFSHAYFFESYAAETIFLELQTSLIQQMEQHFKRLEWCSLHEFAMDGQCEIDDNQRQWIYRQILGRRALVKLYTQHNDMMREADEKWFTATSVGEFHALQHALLEQTLVIWSLIIKLELPGRPVRCLERTAGDLLVGSGWQLILSPQLLSDVCRTLDEQTNGSSTLVERLAKAIELESWRLKLAKNVYEANLLGRIHNFQFGFVNHVSNWDTVLGGDQARHLVFFFDIGECDRAGSLQPIAIELETSMINATNAASTLRSCDSKSVSEWLEAQLKCLTDDCSEAQAESLEPWRRSLLQLQRQYVAYLGGSVKYQDAVGADVFEFAASYPYVCLANSFAPESSDEKSTIAMDLNTVRTKYAKEIADKMTEELKTDCFPYWKRLENLKQQLQERGDREACGHFLDEESSHPRLLTTLNDHLQRLRNEKKLMQHLSAATRARCAFTIQIDEDQSSKLTKWLMTKLHQLKVDLHIHERPKVEQLLLTPPASCSSPLAPPKRVLDLNRSRSSSDIHALLESIPSFRSLLHTFATPASNERPTSGAATAHAIRRQEYREETLRTLVCIFHQFSCTLDLLRIRCGSHFASTRKKILSTPEGTHSGLSRLERWQTLFHHEIRQLLDHLVNRFSPEAALATGDLFDAHPEYLQSQHHTSLMREEMCAALHEANVHLIRILRCTSNFAILQTYQKNAGLHVRKRRQHLMNFQFILEKIITIHGKELSDKASFTANMKQLVLAGEQALFGEVRPREREREWQAFEDAVSKYEPKDIEVMARLLELHRVYIDENCRAALRLAEGDTKPSLSLQCTAENEALVALEDLWERFHLPEWDSSVGATPVIGGENLGMKKRLLLEMGTSSSASSSTELSYALRSLQMGATAPLTHFCTSGLLVLPSPCNVKEQLVYLQLSVELTWVDADMKELEDHYKKLLFRRKKHREHQRTSRKSPQSSCASSSSLLFSLSKYYHEKRISGDTELSDTSPSESVPAFIVPAAEMSAFLHDVTKKCTTHNKHQLDLHSSSIQKMYDHFQAASLTHLKIETQWEKARVEERIRREAFAADHAYHLYFEVEALRKHLRVLEARRELDRQVMRCELNAEYEEKLHAMHEQLLNKQHKFAEYRATMQRELQAVIQGAHSQFVDQLLDYSGTIPSTTKHSVSHLLRGQQDIVRIKSENAAMKQALLKVQALEDMQQQTQNAAKERELLLSQRFATAESLLCSEVEQLQAYVKQLEQNMTKLSREKTYFQVKWTTAHKEMEATAQRRREEKVRILSATHNRTDSEDLPAISPNIRAVPDSTSDTESTLDGSAGRTQNVASTVDTGKQERQRLETQYLNSTRHYQNEIRRLQQQVTRELREKATIAEQLTQLRQYESAASIQADDLQTLGEHSLRRDFRLQPTPRRTQSASPRAVNTCVATPPDRMTILKRPSSSFSPRASLLRAQVTVGSSSNIPVASSRPGTASGTTARKFQVIKRETNAVGGVAGVSNSFSVREPLPYR
ncbi:hypothetical protein PC129_g15739 [Phytophthora cactorum]|uniref:Uncharacterized protein n=1 Tax=Phytophthora cactorum TaxID=29920 RepID=A0A8T1HL32_9STRA|nr:hypothetical protein PC114_g18831 [Phytophthora cactorum]KAG2970210.1 hypothetical protein PC118_g17011 [Phytophthora cactorum]KAG3142886.1 hypothetical protein C6341_g19263 [Phytophthora cactorum]KAG3213324.1 hypothetical protein PC129_g15739 [Phytophthora cactorum]